MSLILLPLEGRGPQIINIPLMSYLCLKHVVHMGGGKIEIGLQVTEEPICKVFLNLDFMNVYGTEFSKVYTCVGYEDDIFKV